MNPAYAIDQIKIVQLHPSGGSRICDLGDVCRHNLRDIAEGRQPEWHSVAAAPGTMEAQAHLADVRKTLRKGRPMDEPGQKGAP